MSWSKILHSIYLRINEKHEIFIFPGGKSVWGAHHRTLWSYPVVSLSNLSRIVCEYSQPSLAFSGTTLFSPFFFMKRHQWQGQTRGGCLCWLVANGGKITELSAHLGVNQHALNFSFFLSAASASSLQKSFKFFIWSSKERAAFLRSLKS